MKAKRLIVVGDPSSPEARYSRLRLGMDRMVVRFRSGRPEADVTGEIMALAGAALDHEPKGDAVTAFLDAGRPEARRVGEVLHAAHGFDGMVAVHDAIRDLIPASVTPDGSAPSARPRAGHLSELPTAGMMGARAAGELEAAWDGVGDWLW